MLEDNPDILDKVKSSEQSDIFHILVLKDSVVGRKVRTACQSYSLRRADSSVEKMNIQEAIDSGMRPCKQCASSLERVHSIDCEVCDLCNRLSLLHEIPYTTYILEYAYGSHLEVSVCLNCQAKMQD